MSVDPLIKDRERIKEVLDSLGIDGQGFYLQSSRVEELAREYREVCSLHAKSITKRLSSMDRVDSLERLLSDISGAIDNHLEV